MTALVSKIAKAALYVGGKLSADKTNKEQNYDYLSSDKILSICGQALFSQGVVVIPELASQETTLYEYTDQYGKAKHRYDSKIAFAFKISDGETDLTQLWYGMGSDYTVPDKALYKAITSGHKYFLMKLLCVGAGNEDGEHEGEDEKKVEKSDGKKPAEKQASKPAGKPVAPLAGHELLEQKVQQGNAPMTIEQAMAIKNSGGITYGDIDSNKLSYMATELANLKTPTPEQVDKLLACQIIMKARAANQPK